DPGLWVDLRRAAGDHQHAERGDRGGTSCWSAGASAVGHGAALRSGRRAPPPGRAAARRGGYTAAADLRSRSRVSAAARLGRFGRHDPLRLGAGERGSMTGPAPDPATSVISVRGLVKRYGPVEAVRGIDLD